MHRGMRELLREEFAEQRDLIREEFSRGMAALAARVTETEARVAGVIAAVATLDARITSKFAQADVAFGPLLRLVPELSVAKDGVADLDERMGRMEKHEVLALAQFHVDQGKSREMAAKVAALTEQVQALEAAARGGEAAGRQVPVAARAPVTVAQPVPAAQQQLPGPPQPPGPPPLPAAVSGGGLTFAVVVRERVSDARHALARGTERALTTLLGPHHVTVVQARVMFANDHKSKVVFTVANEGHAAFIRARMLLPRQTRTSWRSPKPGIPMKYLLTGQGASWAMTDFPCFPSPPLPPLPPGPPAPPPSQRCTTLVTVNRTAGPPTVFDPCGVLTYLVNTEYAYDMALNWTCRDTEPNVVSLGTATANQTVKDMLFRRMTDDKLAGAFIASTFGLGCGDAVWGVSPDCLGQGGISSAIPSDAPLFRCFPPPPMPPAPPSPPSRRPSPPPPPLPRPPCDGSTNLWTASISATLFSPEHYVASEALLLSPQGLDLFVVAGRVPCLTTLTVSAADYYTVATCTTAYAALCCAAPPPPSPSPQLPPADCDCGTCPAGAFDATAVPLGALVQLGKALSDELAAERGEGRGGHLDERMGRMEKHEVLALAQFHVDQGKSREMAAKVAALTEQVQGLEAAARGGEAAGRQVPVAALAPVTVAQPVPAAQQQLPGPPQPPGPPPLPAAVSGGGLTFAVVVRERVSDARHALARGTERALTTLLGPHHVTVVQARVMFANDHKSKVVFTVANEGHAAFIRARMLLPRCTANMRRPGCAIFPHLPYAEHQSQRRMAMRGGPPTVFDPCGVLTYLVNTEYAYDMALNWTCRDTEPNVVSLGTATANQTVKDMLFRRMTDDKLAGAFIASTFGLGATLFSPEHYVASEALLLSPQGLDLFVVAGRVPCLTTLTVSAADYYTVATCTTAYAALCCAAPPPPSPSPQLPPADCDCGTCPAGAFDATAVPLGALVQLGKALSDELASRLA
ncbi:hypothetical protein FOA52_002809 [Chlamydomonas sp. UWO 241]|nr:hypothetical protein FOA52_002809 [Chlamydomonas sp. UWO 241]